MPNLVRSFEINADQTAELALVVEGGDGFRVIGPSDFPSFIPRTLVPKLDSATRIVSGSAGNSPVILYNFRRIDRSEVDEHPYGAMIVSGSSAISSSFLEHGDWPTTQRTTAITQEHASHISASGVGNYFLQHPPEGKISGSLGELARTDLEAFNQFLFSAIKGGT